MFSKTKLLFVFGYFGLRKMKRNMLKLKARRDLHAWYNPSEKNIWLSNLHEFCRNSQHILILIIAIIISIVFGDLDARGLPLVTQVGNTQTSPRCKGLLRRARPGGNASSLKRALAILGLFGSPICIWKWKDKRKRKTKFSWVLEWGGEIVALLKLKLSRDILQTSGRHACTEELVDLRAEFGSKFHRDVELKSQSRWN